MVGGVFDGNKAARVAVVVAVWDGGNAGQMNYDDTIFTWTMAVFTAIHMINKLANVGETQKVIAVSYGETKINKWWMVHILTAVQG